MTKAVFLSGPFRSSTYWGVVQNIRTAELWSLSIWAEGAACLSPHMNTQNFDGALPDSVWLAGAVELMKRCDCVALLPEWRSSLGTIAERLIALKLGMPVFDLGEEADLKAFLLYLRTPQKEGETDREALNAIELEEALAYAQANVILTPRPAHGEAVHGPIAGLFTHARNMNEIDRMGGTLELLRRRFIGLPDRDPNFEQAGYCGMEHHPKDCKCGGGKGIPA